MFRARSAKGRARSTTACAIGPAAGKPLMVRDLAPADTPPNLISAVPSLERLGPEGGLLGDGARVIALGAGCHVLNRG